MPLYTSARCSQFARTSGTVTQWSPEPEPRAETCVAELSTEVLYLASASHPFASVYVFLRET